MARAVEGNMPRDFTNEYNNELKHCGSAKRQAADMIAVPAIVRALSDAHGGGKSSERWAFQTMEEAGAT